MNTEEIIEMARQAGFWKGQVNAWMCTTEELETFAKLVEDAAFKRWAAQIKLAVQDEREACAKVCEVTVRNGAWVTKEEAAAAIRARGEA